MIYTEDRDQLFRDIARPPYVARMVALATPYVHKLRPGDRDLLLTDALRYFWMMRERIRTSQHITRLWVEALSYAACSRVWYVYMIDGWYKVKGSRLGRL